MNIQSLCRIILVVSITLAPLPVRGWAAEQAASPWEPVLTGIGVVEGKTLASDQYAALVKKLTTLPAICQKIRQASPKPVSLGEWIRILQGLGMEPKPGMTEQEWLAVLAQAGVDASKGISAPLAASAPAAVSVPAPLPAPVVSSATVAVVTEVSTFSATAVAASTAAPRPAEAPAVSTMAAAIPDASLAPVPAADAKPVAAPRQGTIPVSLELRGMDIHEVLKMLAKQGSLSMMTNANVRGTVSLSVKNLDLWEALRLVLEANDLAYAYDGRVVRIMTAGDYEKLYGVRFDDKTVVDVIALRNVKASALSKMVEPLKSKVGKVLTYDYSNSLVVIDTPQTIEKMKKLAVDLDKQMSTRIFVLNYAKAEDLLPKIQPLVTKEIGDIEVDKRTNRIVVMDYADHFRAIESLVQAFDRKHLGVLIEARILQVSLNDEYQVGVNWQYVFSQIGNHSAPGTVASNFATLPFTGTAGVANAPNAFTATLGSLTDNKYTALIQALQTVGKTNLLSAPRIAALSNETANILVGTREAYVTTTVTTPGTGASTTAEQVNFVDVGVKLHVTPAISEDDYITVKIKPEVSSVDRTIKTAAGNIIPIVRTSQAETSIVVKDGETILLAGLIEDNVIQTKTGIPILSRIPILGIPFRSRGKRTQKTEITILLTPRVMTEDFGQRSPDLIVVPRK